MRKLLISGCVGSVLAVLLLSGCRTPGLAAQREYKFVRLTWGEKDSPDARLNELARQGWKIEESHISYTPYVYTGDFLFVRLAR